MESNSKKKNIIIAVLSIIIIVLICAVVYFAFVKKTDIPNDNNDVKNQPVEKKEETNSKEDNKQVSDDIEYDEWMSYLLKQNIKSIVYDPGYDPANEEESSQTKISIDALKEFFKEFMSHKYILNKENIQARGAGHDFIIVTYEKNGKEYQFSIEDATYIEKYDDTDFIKILDGMVKEEKWFDEPLGTVYYTFDGNNNGDRFEQYYKDIIE